MEDTEFLTASTDEPIEEKPESGKRKTTGKKGKKHNNKKQKNHDKKKGGKKGLVITLCVIAVIAIIAALFVFVVYGGRHMFLKTELGDGAPEASAFMKNGAEASYVGDVNVSTSKEGTYILKVKSDGKVRPELLIVRDTKAPTSDTTEVQITIDETSLDPEKALGEIKDASSYTASWEKEPEYGTAGSYDCSIKLEDSCGNSRSAKLTVKVLGLVDVLEHEIGQPRPTIDDFMVVERDDAKLVTDLNDIDWNTLGDYEIKAEFDGKTYSSTLRIVDTTAPAPDIVPAAVLVGGKIEASDLALSSGDMTEVSYEFTSEPVVSKVGTVTCGIKATDTSGNSTEAEGKVIVCDVIAELEASLDTVTEADILAALGSDYSGYTMESEAFERTSLGAHAMTFSKNGDKIIVGVVIKDTTAPTAEGVDCQCSTGYYCEPLKFVTNISDMSSVTARFVNEPDWSVEGEQEVQIILTDRGGNETTVNAKAIISPDTTAPVIYAARDRYCYVGEAVSYFKEVFAEDNADPEPELDVDKSNVDSKTAGEYDVTYTATDHEGNSSSVTVKFTFIEKKVSDEQLDEVVDKILGEILTDDMTVPEQAYAIFDYCYSNIIYTGTSDKTDWKSEAYRGLTEGVGDCFTFYSSSYAMLQKIDCQVLSVERMNGRTQHFWCLVNLGTGWYHFDTCNVGPQHLRCFMKTSEELLNYSEQYWRFDTTLYPALETTPYSMN